MQYFLTDLKQLRQQLQENSDSANKDNISQVYTNYAIITRSINSEKELWKMELWDNMAVLDEIKLNIEEGRVGEAKNKLTHDIESLITIMEKKVLEGNVNLEEEEH
jgi:hypothetical protein